MTMFHRTKLEKAVSAVVDWRLNTSPVLAAGVIEDAQYSIMFSVSRYSLTVRSCLCWMRDLAKIDQHLSFIFTAVKFLHVAYKTIRGPMKDGLLDVLATTCLQPNDARRCRNARHSSVLSLSLAAKLMKVVANNSRSTVQLIEIELSKAYL